MAHHLSYLVCRMRHKLADSFVDPGLIDGGALESPPLCKDLHALIYAGAVGMVHWQGLDPIIVLGCDLHGLVKVSGVCAVSAA